MKINVWIELNHRFEIRYHALTVRGQEAEGRSKAEAIGGLMLMGAIKDLEIVEVENRLQAEVSLAENVR